MVLSKTCNASGTGYSSLSTTTNTCAANPCGVDTLDLATTNGTACPVQLFATVTKISTGAIVSSQNLLTPGADIYDGFALKYDEKVEVKCVNATNIDPQKHDRNTGSYLGVFTTNTSSWPSSDNNYVGNSSFNYNNTSATSGNRLNFNCYNKGGNSNNKQLFVYSPKKFVVKYIDMDGSTEIAGLRDSV